MKGHEDLRGRKFSRLTAIRFEGANQNGNALWLFECRCGCRFIALAANVKSGKTRSCGCYRSEATRRRNMDKFSRV